MKTTLWQTLTTHVAELLAGPRAQKFKELKQAQQAIYAVRNTLAETQATLQKPIEERAYHQQDAKSLLYQLSVPCSHFDSAERIKSKPYLMNVPTFDRNLVAPQLMQDVADTAEKLIAEHEPQTLDWNEYIDVCKFAPQATNLWRQYDESVLMRDAYEIKKIIDIMPEKIASQPQMSNDGTTYFGALHKKLCAVPVATFSTDDDVSEDDVITYAIGDYDGNKGEILSDLEYYGLYTDEQIVEVNSFIQEAENVFQKEIASHKSKLEKLAGLEFNQ